MIILIAGALGGAVGGYLYARMWWKRTMLRMGRTSWIATMRKCGFTQEEIERCL